MSPFDFKSEGDARTAWRAQVHAEATQKLAQALVEQEAVLPATNALEFQRNLSLVIERLAHEELVLIESITGMDLLNKLAAAQIGEPVEFTPAQARALGAFAEDAIGDGDLDMAKSPAQEVNKQEGSAS